MKYIKNVLLKTLFCSLLLATAAAQSRLAPSHHKYQAPSNKAVANILGWVPSNHSCYMLCGGYFLDPKIIRENPHPLPYTELPTTITAKGPTIFSLSGQSILQKDVRVTQPGRLTTADKAYVYRDKHTGKIARVKLVGHVHIQEPGKALISHQASLNLKKNTAEIDHIAYRIFQEKPRFGKYNGWGSAEYAKHLSTGVIKLHHATYSTCSPLHPAWQVSASQITVDKKKKRITAKNAVIKLHHIPLLWAPRISFSMNNKRKSGLLAPLIQNSSYRGFSWSQSYYFNLAPNDDLKLDAIYMSKRGVQFNSLFRYLTKSSVGNLYLSFLPKDREFRKFKTKVFEDNPPPISKQLRPYIEKLHTTNNSRGYFAYNNISRFGGSWASDIELNYVTDPYYFRDFGTSLNEVAANQLRNEARLAYTGTHWDFSGLVLGYQTLHLIDQWSATPTVNQYTRLPEIDASGDYPNIFTGVNFGVNTQIVNFKYHSAFPPFTLQQPEGLRLHILPSLSRPINWASAYVTPTLSIDSTSYDVTRRQVGQAKESSRNIPFVDIDSGLYFDRLFHWGHKAFFQTLEPRLFYLYVPYVNQDKYPNYDTQVLPFSYDQLFAVNRFTGLDRFQNSNQVSLGLTSRILNSTNAYQSLKADIGMGYYIERPRVCLTPDCKNDHLAFTPLATRLTFHPTQHWSTSASFAWDTELHQTNNAQFNINYQRNGKNIIGGGYTFVHAQPGSPPFSMLGFSNDASFYNVHVAWPLTNHWSTMGYLYYNNSTRRTENFFAGLQYDSCCWSFRFIFNKTFTGSLPVNNGLARINKYDTRYVFQIQLKGIGSTGNSNPNTLLTEAMPGYSDPFKY